MTEVDSKSTPPAVSDHPAPSEHENDGNNQDPDGSQFPPQGPSGQPFPPPNFAAYYNYPPGQAPPPGEGGNQDANGQPQPNGNAPPGFPPPPPGMMFSYPYPQPPPGYMPVSMAGMPLPGALIKPKRKQVKMACTNCAAACKRCDVSRPCERCIKYGLADTCRDGQRKERKKGFKRGPYNKRKRQEEREAHEWEAAQNNPNGEWTPGPNGAPFPGGPQGGFPPPPEGYYPAFYALAPPPPGPGPQLVPVAQTGSPSENPVEGEEGNADPNAQGDQSQGPQGPPVFPPPHGQFVYPHLPPGAYPPFGYPFPPPQPPPPQQQSPETTSGSGSAQKRPAPDDDTKEEDDEEDPPTPPRKRRGRRNSDADWPGVSKRVGKAKVENPTPTRRSTRRQQHMSEQGETGADGPQAAGAAHNGDSAQAPEGNALQQHLEDPVLSETTAI